MGPARPFARCRGGENIDAIASVAEHPCDVIPAERAGHRQGNALPLVDVHQREGAHMLPRRQDVVHEVDRPAFVRCADGDPRLPDRSGASCDLLLSSA
jgi:hypothetical protein